MDEITVGILAGGQSSRMGENKAFLKWRETTFLWHLVQEASIFSQVLVSAADRELYAGTDMALVEDERKSYGPLEGIYQLLKHADAEWVLVIATDMPLFDREVMKKMAAVERKQVQAVVFREEDKVHPLCGLYHVSCILTLEELFKEGCHSVRALLERIIVKYVTPEELGTDREVLTNVNTPSEYGKLRKKDESCSDNLQ